MYREERTILSMLIRCTSTQARLGHEGARSPQRPGLSPLFMFADPRELGSKVELLLHVTVSARLYFLEIRRCHLQRSVNCLHVGLGILSRRHDASIYFGT